jgi:outer membrane lipoprotein-sorting protein
MALSRRTALATLAAFVASPALADIAPDDQVQVNRAAAYLDSIVSVKSRFTQADGAGNVVLGTVWLAKPGRARFQYDPPSGLLITSDGSQVTVTDSRLKTRQRVPLSSTPLSGFLADHIRLDTGVRITRVDRQAGAFSITARSTAALAQGEITLYFADSPLRLSGWVIIDAQARLTRVTLDTLTPAPAAAPSLFTQ